MASWMARVSKINLRIIIDILYSLANENNMINIQHIHNIIETLPVDIQLILLIVEKKTPACFVNGKMPWVGVNQ